MLKNETNALNRIGLPERILVHRVGVAFQSQLAIGCEHVLDIEVAENGLIGDIVVSITEIAVDNESSDRINFKLGLVFLCCVHGVAIATNIKAYGELIRQFGEPGVDLSGHGR